MNTVMIVSLTVLLTVIGMTLLGLMMEVLDHALA